MEVKPLKGDYCERCAHTLGVMELKRYMIIPMCEPCIDVWFRSKDWQIANKFFKKHDQKPRIAPSDVAPGT